MGNLNAVKELRIQHSEPTITVTDADARTRVLDSSWKDWQVDSQGNDTKCYWKKGRLVVKTKALDDREMTHKYEINEEGQLVVATTLTMGQMGNVTFKRVYDRADVEG